jgi:hypothetical protein
MSREVITDDPGRPLLVVGEHGTMTIVKKKKCT